MNLFEKRDLLALLRGDLLWDKNLNQNQMVLLWKLTGQQCFNPPGGRYDYVINGNMIAGYAMIAFPADYDNSGIAALLISHQGELYEKDLGEDTDLIAGRIDEYNPDETWNRVTD
jgi:hypothetical protein